MKKRKVVSSSVVAVAAAAATAEATQLPTGGAVPGAEGGGGAVHATSRKRSGRLPGQSAKPPTSKRMVEGSGEPAGVTLNHLDVATGKAAIAALSRDRRTLSGVKGYKLVRATRGVSEGTWFCEWTVQADSKSGGHVRLGWANECADAHAAVGFDEHSYALRDATGSRVHQSIRTPYCPAFGPGDVIGCLITFDTPRSQLEAATAQGAAAGIASAGPADGWRVRQAQALVGRPGASRAELESVLFQAAPPGPLPWCSQGEAALQQLSGDHRQATAAPLLVPGSSGPSSSSSASSSSGAGAANVSATAHAGAPPLDATWQPGENAPKNQKRAVNQRYWGSSIRFFVNGADQGLAFVHLTREHKYYPAASCYDGGSVRFNPGPSFAFAPVGGPPPPTALPDAATVALSAQQLGSPSASAPPPPQLSDGGALAAGGRPPDCAWGPWRPISDLEQEGEGSDAGTGTLLDLLRLPYRGSREPSLEGLQSMLAAGRVSAAPVTFSGAATASYASALGFGGRAPPAARAPMGPLGLPMSTITHRIAAPLPPGAGNKAVELLQRAAAAAAAAAKQAHAKS